MESTRITSDADEEDYECSMIVKGIDDFDKRQGEKVRQICKYPGVALDKLLAAEEHTSPKNQ